MKSKIARLLIIICLSTIWTWSFGQNFPKLDTINGMVVEQSAFLMHDKRNPAYYQINSTISPVRTPNKKFNVLENNPYDLNKIKIDASVDLSYSCGKVNTNFEYVHRMHPKLALRKIDSFDFLEVTYEIVRGTAFTCIAYALVANESLDEGDYVARKAIYTFAVIDKTNNVKWYRDISIPTNNFNISYSKDGKFAVIPGSRIEKEAILNHIYLVSLEDKRVIYNFLPNNEESVLYDTQLRYREAMIIAPHKINEKAEDQYYFDTKSRNLYRTEPISKLPRVPQNLFVNTIAVWDEKSTTMCYYNQNDRLRTKKTIEQKYTKIKTIK